MSVVAVVDFGTGNLRSVQKAVEHVADKGTRVVVTNDLSKLQNAERLVLPGQGAIGTCLRAMSASGLVDAIEKMISTKPTLGICLGLQVMYDYSEEGGKTRCLGRLSGEVRHFKKIEQASAKPKEARLKIPHMGWNNVHQTRQHPLWRSIGQDDRFYFVHSYYVKADDPNEVFGLTEYGGPFTSAGGKDNFFGVQFHPEKSQRAGLQLMRNFVTWDGTA